MKKLAVILLLALPLSLGGCLAQAAIGLATAPIKVAAKAVDWTTTSRDEADRNAGRKLRKEKSRCRHHPDECEVAKVSRGHRRDD